MLSTRTSVRGKRNKITEKEQDQKQQKN